MHPLELNLLGITALLAIRGLCQKLELPRPPQVLPLLAIVVTPWLNHALTTNTMSPSGKMHLYLLAINHLLIGYTAVRVAGWLGLQIPPHLGWWKAVPKIIGDLAMVSVSAALTLIVVHQDLQINLIGIAATSAVLTAVIGLAGQATLKDIFAGIALQVDAPFQEGDWIDIGFAQGIVRSLRLMSTRLNTIDGAQIVVPNSRITAEGMRRFRPNEPVGQHLEIALDYNFPARQAIQLLEGIMNDHVEIRQHPNPKAWLIRYNESGVVYRLQYWQNRLGALAEYELRSQIYEQIWYALTRIGQIPPYPGLAIRDGNLLDDQGNEALSDRERIMILTKNELFKTLTAAQLQTLAKATRELRFAPLEAVVRQGESGESLYLVAEGRLVATRTTEEGKTKTIHTFSEGEIFGEMAVFTGSARTATIQCLEETLLLEVGRPALLSLMQEDHLLLEHLSDLVTQREKELDQLNSESNASDGHQEMRSKIKQLFEKLLKGLH